MSAERTETRIILDSPLWKLGDLVRRRASTVFSLSTGRSFSARNPTCAICGVEIDNDQVSES
jgi:hypothetical protein